MYVFQKHFLIFMNVPNIFSSRAFLFCSSDFMSLFGLWKLHWPRSHIVVFFFGLFGILMSLEYPAFWFWFCFGFAHFSPALPYDFLFSTYMYVLWTWASLWIPRFSFLCVYFQILATVHPNRAVCKNVCEWETGELAPGWDRGKPTAHSLSVGRQRHEEREARS